MFGLPVFNCVPTIEAIYMLVMIHLRLASQQCLVVALTTLSTIEIHMVLYTYTRKAFLQFESPKWNILVACDLPEIYALALRLCPCICAYISGKSPVPMLQLLHIYIYIYIRVYIYIYIYTCIYIYIYISL